MARRARPNDPCPCGSGLKYKKCCNRAGNDTTAPVVRPAAPYSSVERATAIAKLVALWEVELADEARVAHEEFWGEYLDRDGELPATFAEMSLAAEQAWFAFDRAMDDGRRPVDALLEDTYLGPGERAFLRAARRSTQRLYEVVDAIPGRSITFEDILEGTRVTVHERSASRSVNQRDCLAARIVDCGSSGQPELELGVLPIPALYRDGVVREQVARRDGFLEDVPGAALDEMYEEQPPWFHSVWLGAIFDPAIPELANTDGDPLVTTTSVFAILDAAALERRLDVAQRDGVVRVGDGWDWVGATRDRSDAVLATLRIGDGSLVVEANSVARGARARALVERLARALVRHRATTHADASRQVREAITARILGGDAPDRDGEPSIATDGDAIDPAAVENVVLDMQAKHYRAWIDLPIPVLAGRSPRDAAADPSTQPQVIELLRDLMAMYQTALRQGAPAYDPSWMWIELGLAPANPPATQPLAHERIAAEAPDFADATRAAADRLRGLPGFDPAATVARAADLELDLGLQRWIRGEQAPFDLYARVLVDFELHRRKVFWVDETLAWLLEHTDVELAGEQLRAPFPSCAFVFADRHVLGLAERALARHREDPLCGQLLRVVTAYVTERRGGDDDGLDVTFALDALGSDLPSVLVFRIPAEPHALAAWLAALASTPMIDPPVRDASPVRALLRVLINALRYSTSASMTSTPVERASSPLAARPRALEVPPSASVFHLPGKIEIRQLRALQALQRTDDGREALARFMVRGHWRRAAASWADRRPRWIEPYWKGPDLAAVIEKAYRLRGPG